MTNKEKQQLAFSRGEVPALIRVIQGVLVLSGAVYLVPLVVVLDIRNEQELISAIFLIVIPFFIYLWVICRTDVWQKAGAANLVGFICTAISTFLLLALIWDRPTNLDTWVMVWVLVWSLSNLTWLALTFTPTARAFFERVEVVPEL